MIEPILEKHKSKLNILPKEYLAIFSLLVMPQTVR